MYLGIEIGGTKLQLGVGGKAGDQFEYFERFDIDRAGGASEILSVIDQRVRKIIEGHPVSGIGIGFGGPVDVVGGSVVRSHHVDGWDGFNLSDWFTNRFGLETVIDNDCNVCALAESVAGAGTDWQRVFYVTVGTGIGGGLAVDGEMFGAERPAITELGHLRPYPDSKPEAIVEDYAAGHGIEQRFRELDSQQRSPATKEIVEMAVGGDPLAVQIIGDAMRVLGWAVAQAITITSPEIVVIGGGVSLAGEENFFKPVRSFAHKYVMEALRDTYKIAPANLGEDVVVHGAIELARSRSASDYT